MTSQVQVKKTSLIESNPDKIQKGVVQYVKKAKELSDKIVSGTMSFSYGGRPVRALPSDVVRVFSQTKAKDSQELFYRNVVLNSIISSEISSPYSSIAFLEMLSGKTTNLKAKTRAEKSDLHQLLRKNLGSGITYQIVKNILESGGMNSDVSFDVSKKPEGFKVFIENTYEIKGNLPEVFNAALNASNDMSMVIIDGIIEKVSEIHHLLETAASSNRGLLIVAKKFYPDVANTLSENYKNGKLSVIPFETSFKEEELDKLEKVGVFCVRYENEKSIFTTAIDDIDKSFHIDVTIDKLKISGIDGQKRNCKVSIPPHFKNQAGIIEDRVLSGLCFARDISKYGVVTDDNGNPINGLKQIKTARKTYKSFLKTINDLGCIITHHK